MGLSPQTAVGILDDIYLQIGLGIVLLMARKLLEQVAKPVVPL